MACLDAVSHDEFLYSLLILACNQGLALLVLRTVSHDTTTGITSSVAVFVSGESQLEDFIQGDSVLLELNGRLATLWFHCCDGAVTRSLQRTRQAESESLQKALPWLLPGLRADPVFADRDVLRLKSLTR